MFKTKKTVIFLAFFQKNRYLARPDPILIPILINSEINPDGDYEDVNGFCKSATVEEVAALDYVLTPGRYVGLPDDEDDFDFNERFTKLKAELEEQMLEEERLNAQILKNLKKVVLSEDFKSG